ncbi:MULTISPECIES: hypothetical protein [Halocynthiibacter]|uniref:Uncharacterized protein n=1 Tax=Halocynthiibacter halioticoli TaxID=2986804 RepID=A0AAE3J1D7_9RHOB|nr:MULTISPECIES: hypothetical protein [Halocynthiibacter]MCV6824930.1 hypothetical protein [Halocynthiibacter halioticoli]MCW4057931.1 hypothetical protein [Halocynthiibacter sp. SDUM655004]
MIGHNGGPVTGTGWNKHCWSKARKDLLPQLPIEVIRTRLRRAKELGLDYKSYASVRSKTGHDIVALLFSSNALRVFKDGQPVAEAKLQKLAALKHCDSLIAAAIPVSPQSLANQLEDGGVQVLTAFEAPTLAHGIRETREAFKAALSPSKLPGDKVLIVGDTMLEAEWADIARLGAYLPAETYFAGQNCQS